MKMRVIRYNVLFAIGLAVTIEFSAALANGGNDHRRPKDTGVLTVRTSLIALMVIIDDVEAGQSGVGAPAEFYLPYGVHKVEVIGPDGRKYQTQEYEIRKGGKIGICLKIVENTITRPCPYRFHLEGPEKIMEGDLVTFTAVPDIKSPVPLRFGWRVDNGRVTSGIGTPSITVDSGRMGGRTSNGDLEVNDNVLDEWCWQVTSVLTD